MLFSDIPELTAYERVQADELEKKLSKEEIEFINKIFHKYESDEAYESDDLSVYDDLRDDLDRAKLDVEIGIDKLEDVIEEIQELAENKETPISHDDVADLINDIQSATSHFDDIRDL